MSTQLDSLPQDKWQRGEPSSWSNPNLYEADTPYNRQFWYVQYRKYGVTGYNICPVNTVSNDKEGTVTDYTVPNKDPKKDPVAVYMRYCKPIHYQVPPEIQKTEKIPEPVHEKLTFDRAKTIFNNIDFIKYMTYVLFFILIVCIIYFVIIINAGEKVLSFVSGIFG